MQWSTFAVTAFALAAVSLLMAGTLLITQEGAHSSELTLRSRALHPKTALLFLARGPLPLEPAWREFFRAAALVDPTRLPPLPEEAEHHGGTGNRVQKYRRYTRHLQQGPEQSTENPTDPNPQLPAASHRSLQQRRTSRARRRRAVAGSGREDVIAQQQLFSVYVHTAPGYRLAPFNAFAGYEVPERVVVAWGQFSVVEAEKSLFRAALRDPQNQRFVVLSESCLPLYPPQLLYMQLLSEPRSRVNACRPSSKEELLAHGFYRWHPAMAEPPLRMEFWRKSSQWVSLTRRHAEAIGNDVDIARIFKRECYSLHPSLPIPQHMDPLHVRADMARQCVADEHYVPTVLAAHGMGEETDCFGMMTHASWAPDGWSPKTYSPYDVTPAWLRVARQRWFSGGENCSHVETLRSANSLLQQPQDEPSVAALAAGAADGDAHPFPLGWASRGSWDEFVPLSPLCSLFARKFDVGSIDPVMRLAADCEEGFGWAESCM